MVLALASSRKSRFGCDNPLTLFRTWRRVKSSIEIKVPTSGVNPGCGPTIHALLEEALPSGANVSVESPTASPKPPLRKLRRFGRHSNGNIDRPPQVCVLKPQDHTPIWAVLKQILAPGRIVVVTRALI